MALQLAFAAAGAGAFGALGFFNAKQRNRTIRRNARNQFDSIDDQVRQSRLGFYDRTSIASQEATAAEGQYRNSVGFASGLSLREFFAQSVADIETDQSIRARNLQKTEEAAQIQKRNIAEAAEASQSSPLLAAVQGGIQGASALGALGGAIDNLNAASKQNKLADQQSALNEARLNQAEQGIGFQRSLFDQQQRLGGLREQLLNTQIQGAQNTLFFNAFGSVGNPLLGGL